jgi:hypothetical protein
MKHTYPINNIIGLKLSMFLSIKPASIILKDGWRDFLIEKELAIHNGTVDPQDLQCQLSFRVTEKNIPSDWVIY